MAKSLLPDNLWAVIAPLLPPPRPRPKGGRPRIDDRQALTGIVFVLGTGIAGERLPVEMGRGSGMTRRRRLRDWHEAGAWERLPRVLRGRLGIASAIDWRRAALDSAAVPAKTGATRPAPTRRSGVDRAPSATSSPIAPASPWPSASARPTRPTAGFSSR